MRPGRCVVTFAKCLLAFFLALATFAGQSAHGQEKTVQFAPREEMIDAIMHYAGSGGCETLRNVFGPRLEIIANAFASPGRSPDDICKAGVWSFGDLSLHRAQDATLIEICTRNKIVDCRKRQEVSTGAPVLTFLASVGVKHATQTAAWSPDNRSLLVYAYPPLDRPPRLGYTLIIDIEQQQSRALLTDPVATLAVAWSPDGKYIAVNDQRAIHLYASDTLEEKGRIEPRGTKCGIYESRNMAFTADSMALWVACNSTATRYGQLAIKLGVPALQIEDRLLPVPLAPDWRGTFRATEITRFGDDLLLIGVAHGRSYDNPQIAAQSFSLSKKEPIHPPDFYASPERGESHPDVFLTDDLSGILIRYSVIHPDGAQLWSTRSGERIARLHPKTMMDGRALGAPNRIPSSPLHIEEQWLPDSVRRTLVVLDSRSGATVQEIGPVGGKPYPRPAGTRNLVVSPDGRMVAHFGRYEVRFYRVDAAAAAQAPGPGQ